MYILACAGGAETKDKSACEQCGTGNWEATCTGEILSQYSYYFIAFIKYNLLRLLAFETIFGKSVEFDMWIFCAKCPCCFTGALIKVFSSNIFVGCFYYIDIFILSLSICASHEEITL